MIPGFLSPSPSPKTNSIYLWRHQDTSTQSRKNNGAFSKHIIFINVNSVETQYVDIYRKDGHRTMVKIRLMQSPKSWICISYLSKIWNGHLVICNGFFENIRHFLKPRNHKPQTKHQETLHLFLFSSNGIPSTPQHIDSHPCTRPAWSRSLSGWPRRTKFVLQPGLAAAQFDASERFRFVVFGLVLLICRLIIGLFFG